MASTALVRDNQISYMYHPIVIDEKKFEKQQKDTAQTWNKASAAWKTAAIGTAIGGTGVILLITGQSTDTGISMAVIGAVIDAVACCLAMKK